MVKIEYPDWLKSTSQLQLEGELAPLEKTLENYVANPPAEDKVQIAKNALNLVRQAKDELDRRRIQKAWTLYYEAERLHYMLLQPKEIEGLAGKILLSDSCVLGDGENKCVRRLIGEDAGNGDWRLKPGLDTEDVIEARRVVQDHYNEKYTSLSIALDQLGLLAIVALALSVAIIFVMRMVPSNSLTFDSLSASNFAAFNVSGTGFSAVDFAASNFTATDVTVSYSNQISSANLLFWIVIGLFGAVGGSISGLYGIRQAYAAKSDIPERVLNNWITLAKPVVGFAAAIIIAVFLVGGLVQAANLALSNYVVYSMAFISGFSERLIIGAVEERLPS